MDISEVKTLVEQIGKAFHDFRAENDKRLEAIEGKGFAPEDTVEKVEKINAHIDALQDELKAAKKRADDLELAVNRARLSGGDGDTAKAAATWKAARQFQAMQKKVPVDTIAPEAVDVESFLKYKGAFNQYCRYGDKMSGVQASLSVGSDPDGGYWVPPDQTGRIAQLVFESSPMRSIASVVTIGSDSLEGFNDLDQAASGGWVGETAARGETGTPQVGKWRIDVHEQFAQPKVTQKLLDDSAIDIEGWLSGKIAGILERTETTAFFTGNGVAKARGILTYPAGTPSKASWAVVRQFVSGASGAFAATNPGDFLIDQVFGLKAAYRAGARWVLARSTVGAVRKLKDGQGNYLWVPNFAEIGGSGNLVGFPITEAEDMPAIGANSLSIAFGNMAEAYQIVDRFGIRVLRDPFTEKPFVKFYTTKRVGGDMVNFEALSLMKFSA